MFNKLTFALVLIAMCLSLVSGAEAGSDRFGDRPTSFSGLDLDSGG